MDPDLLRVLTGPEASKDPAQLRAAMNTIRTAARQSALRSVRLNALALRVVGYGLIAGGLGVVAARVAGQLPHEAVYVGVIVAAVGGLFTFLARLTALPPLSLLKNGSRLQATVREVKAVGRTLGIEKPGLSATLSRVTVVLEIPELGAAGANLEHSQFILGDDLGRLQVGATVPVRCDLGVREDWRLTGRMGDRGWCLVGGVVGGVRVPYCA